MHQITYLALGDSYTIGEAVPASESFPVQATSILRSKGVDIANPQIIAVTGWTTDELNSGIDNTTLHPPYTMVTLLIGVNNQYRGRSLEEYRTEFTGLLKRAIHLAGDKPSAVVVLSIPDWGVTPFAKERDINKIASEIDAFNAINKEITMKSGAGYLDITGYTREALTDPDLVAPDGLHPSGKDYKRWAEALAPLLYRIL